MRPSRVQLFHPTFMQILAIHEAKNNFSALLHAVEAGDEVVLTRHGKPVARLIREEAATTPAPSREAQMAEAMAKLRAYREQVQPVPAVPGYSDWKTLRDLGRDTEAQV